jgi:diguanylate cyclase (GGDEF)-like protein/hemerythrin-like metal-binding protein
MENGLVAQLDYIFFFYGLVLILLGTVCVSITRAGPFRTPWWILGGFAFAHGLSEWLHLPLLMAGGSGRLKLASTLLTAASFFFLLEFARRTHRLIKGTTPGPWLHAAPSAAMLAITLAFGATAFSAAVRLLVAWPAATWTCGLFLVAGARTEALDGKPASRLARRWSAFFFGAYGLASGLVVPSAPFLPATWPSPEAFLAWTGVPLQLIRALLLSGVAFSVWVLAISFDSKGSVSRKRQVLFWVMATSIAALIAGGWLFTDWLGRVQEQDVRRDAESSAAQFHDNLVDHIQVANGGARSAAQLLSRLEAFASPVGQARLDATVDSLALAAVGWTVYVLDQTGTTIATSNRGRPDSFLGKNYAGRRYFQEALAGRSGQLMAMGIVSRVPGYFSSEPVRRPDGTVVGVAVVKVNLTGNLLASTETDDAFIVSPDGRVLAASREDQVGRLLWRDRGRSVDAPAGTDQPAAPAILDRDRAIVDTERVSVDRRKKIATRLPLLGSDWSLVVLRTETTQALNRLLGIVITLLLSAVVLGSFVALQRQLGAEATVDDKRRRAEGRAREFARKADTDALTGLLNRLGFNGAFVNEFERARRYRQALSVVILDLDHFKRVNDEHGHVAGDQVLIRVARLIEAQTRQSDTVARWGGEEFVVLAPMTEASGATQLAEKLRALMEATPLGPVGAVTGSFGVAELQPGDSIESLLHRADEALYRVKNSTRNGVACAAAVVTEGSGSPPASPEELVKAVYVDTGFEPIDREHRVVAVALETFVRKVDAGLAEEARLALVAVLARAGDHFGHEARLMEEFGYPLRRRHEENHALFVEDVHRFLVELRENGLTLSLRSWAGGRLLDWFRLHVEAHDVALGHFLLEEGAVESPVRAMAG